MHSYKKATQPGTALGPNLPRRRMLVSSGMIAAALLFGGGSAFAAGRSQSGSIAALTADEAADLRYIREEEKVARDVYLAMYQRWGLPIFSTIASSEQQHMDAVFSLLSIYGVADPAERMGQGMFYDPRLQALYDQLIARGTVSMVEALRVGGLIEETDIRDLQRAIDEAEAPNLDRVYSNLMSGSRSHLQAFAYQVKRLTGVPYSAQVLTAAQLASIIGS